jgi:hypothetical protein
MLEHLSEQIDELDQEVKHSFRRHPAADIVRSCPGLFGRAGRPGSRRILRLSAPIP